MAAQDKTHGERSLFRTILVPLLCLLAVEVLIFLGSLYAVGVTGQLDQNAREIADKKVENRQSYLENYMVENWSDLSWVVRRVNRAAQEMLDRGELSLEELDSNSEACAPLLLELGNDLVSTLYAKQVSGIFVVFNTGNLDEKSDTVEKTGIYIRDLDPRSQPSEERADLLLERAPIAVVQEMNISTDSAWNPLFRFSHGYYDFFFQPYYAASTQLVEDPADYGYWSRIPYTLRGSDVSSVSYSVPLVLEDGTVYGVLGVEVLTSYLSTLLPWEELADGQWSSYCLAVLDRETGDWRVNLVNGPAGQELAPGDLLPLERDEADNLKMKLGQETYYAAAAPFSLYNNNTPFEGEQWLLLGLVPEKELYAFSNQFRGYLHLVIFCTLVSGVLGTIFISRRVSRPVRGLYRELARARQGAEEIPTLPSTGILEIDQFSRIFASLSRDVVDASTKFLRIMEMASVEIGGFEMRRDKGAVFVTENFFPMFGCEGVKTAGLTPEEFREKIRWIYQHTRHTASDQQNTVFQVELPQGDVRYIHVEITEDEQRWVGLAEDVTQSTLERLRIERERDYDLLTGLYSRRAFYQKAEQLFREPERLKQAALVMLDLDNLKQTNDRFGHDWGDQYIRQAGQCFAGAVPRDALCARISGDEFCLLLYGFSSREEGRKALSELARAIRESAFALPNGEIVPIGASGGVAWYPQDSGQFRELLRYADFAMYQIKQLGKGSLGEFERQVYQRQHALIQSRRELIRLLDDQQVTYHFQPIVDGETGEPVGYEALMRPSLPHLSCPEAVLSMAEREGRLYDVERMTFRRALDAFRQLTEQAWIPPQALLFLNSVADQRMSQSDIQTMVARWGDILPRTVLEFSARRELDPGALELKRMSPGFSGMTALDNCVGAAGEERALWLLSPKFVKIDRALIRGLDGDGEKRQGVSHIVEQAHSRGIRVVAVGVESGEELETVLTLGVDCVQGAFLARPSALPLPVSSEAVERIRRFRGKGTPSAAGKRAAPEEMR